MVAVGDRVLLYDSKRLDNSLQKTLSMSNPSGIVYCLAFSKDGKRFASGGSNKKVVIWLSSGGGEKKYSHNTSVQCLAFNPVVQTVIHL